MKRWIGWGAGSVLWFAGLEGVLQLQKLPAATLGGHDVCGPWGCGPPLPVLVACHGFWLTLIGPPAVLAAVYLPRKWAWRLGIAMAAAGPLRTGGARRVGGGFVASTGQRLAAAIPRASVFVRDGDACRRADHAISRNRLRAVPGEFVANRGANRTAPGRGRLSL
jgi:hypothetical protein